jgi:hypothetical protein
MCIFLCKYHITPRRFINCFHYIMLNHLLDNYKSRIVFGSEWRRMWPLIKSVCPVYVRKDHAEIYKPAYSHLSPFPVCGTRTNSRYNISLDPAVCSRHPKTQLPYFCYLVTRQLINCAGYTASLRRVNAKTNSEGNASRRSAWESRAVLPPRTPIFTYLGSFT